MNSAGSTMGQGRLTDCPTKYHEIVPLLLSAGKRLDRQYGLMDAEKDYLSDPLIGMYEAWKEKDRLERERRDENARRDCVSRQ